MFKTINFEKKGVHVYRNGVRYYVKQVRVLKGDDFDSVIASGVVNGKTIVIEYKGTTVNQETGEISVAKPFLRKVRHDLIDWYLVKRDEELKRQILPVCNEEFVERLKNAGFDVHGFTVSVGSRDINIEGMYQVNAVEQIGAVIAEETAKAEEKVNAFFAKYEVA